MRARQLVVLAGARGPDRVRQLSEQTPDDGKTWLVNFDLIYLRRKSATP